MDKWEVFTKRKVVKIEQFENEIKNWEFPLVIKPGDDLSDSRWLWRYDLLS